MSTIFLLAIFPLVIQGQVSPKVDFLNVWEIFLLSVKIFQAVYNSMYIGCVCVSLFVCLFVWFFPSYSRIFHSYGDVTIAGEGLQILTSAHLFKMVISERKAVEFSLPVLRLSSVAAGIRTPNRHYMAERLPMRLKNLSNQSIKQSINRTPNLPLANALGHCATIAVKYVTD